MTNTQASFLLIRGAWLFLFLGRCLSFFPYLLLFIFFDVWHPHADVHCHCVVYIVLELDVHRKPCSDAKILTNIIVLR